LPHQKILYSGRTVSGKERSFHDEKGINSLRDIKTAVHKNTGIRLCKVPYRVSTEVVGSRRILRVAG